jgi:membrane-associated phospholipid phosphatase
MIPWHLITFVGDSLITVPAAAAIVLWLISAGAWRMAFYWCLLFGGGCFVVVASKIAFIGWGLGLPGLDFTGVSGHAMRACAILPVLGWLLLRPVSPTLRKTGMALAVGLATLISISRLVLHYHSLSEVVTGIGLGMLVAIAFIKRFEHSPGLRLQRWVVGLTILWLIPSTYAEPAPTQRWMTSVALYLSGHDRPYMRKPNGGLARAPAETPDPNQ